MIMKFETDATCQACVAAIKNALAPLAPKNCWEVNLNVARPVLTYTGTLPVDTSKVIELVQDAGFEITRIDD